MTDSSHIKTAKENQIQSPVPGPVSSDGKFVQGSGINPASDGLQTSNIHHRSSSFLNVLRMNCHQIRIAYRILTWIKHLMMIRTSPIQSGMSEDYIPDSEIQDDDDDDSDTSIPLMPVGSKGGQIQAKPVIPDAGTSYGSDTDIPLPSTSNHLPLEETSDSKKKKKKLKDQAECHNQESTHLAMSNKNYCYICDFLGHDIRVHQDFYRLPVPTTQLAKISKLLLSMEKGHLSSIQEKSLDEIEIEDEIALSDTEAKDSMSESDDSGTAFTECATSEPVDAATDSTVTEQVHDAGDFEAVSLVTSTVNETVTLSEGQDAGQKHESRRVPKKAWSKAEVAAVMRHFRNHISKGKLATKNECGHFLVVLVFLLLLRRRKQIQQASTERLKKSFYPQASKILNEDST
ncbi:hypothetical protein L3Q82_005874 [Scortum barcoo]|uniref:Uncharacterized protein n=1 Tax=Scortum barcoo TaxID=214431 RepID=A0ACB8V707_9TELE|nr:hypothetical protein L3Q82_005874 [Scortum barcoo]